MTAHELPPDDGPHEPPDDPDYGAAYDAPPPIQDAVANERPNDPTVPHSRSAEMALLGALLSHPEQAPEAATLLDGTDFYEPHHETIWNAIHAVTATGAKAEALVVLDHLNRTKQARPIGGAPYLFELIQAGYFGQVEEYARIVRDTARLRAANNVATAIRGAVATARPETVDRALEQAVTTLDETFARHAATRTVRRHHVETIDELLAGEHDDSYDWVIPDLIEHQERVILTAEEGAGKSTLLRQIAIQAASGIHPFTLAPINPITVLHVDVENTRRQSRRRYRPMRTKAGPQLHPDKLRIELRTAGLDLTTDTDRDWLLDTCRHVRPDLLLIGPIYKLANGDPTEEKSAKPVAMAIDAVREQTDCAVILEAHAPKKSGPGKRPHEPYGWSGWMRWPEVGLWLDTDGVLSPWRGAREERSWPTQLTRGGAWPWTVVQSDLERDWQTLLAARRRLGQALSIREAAKHCDLTKRRIEQLISPGCPYHQQWKSINGTDPQMSLEEDDQ